MEWSRTSLQYRIEAFAIVAVPVARRRKNDLGGPAVSRMIRDEVKLRSDGEKSTRP